METAGYIASIFIGVVLGLLGGGGSILTVPVLVYLLHVAPLEATAYSLFIVGITSLIGAVGYLRNGWLNIRMTVIFGAHSMIAVYLTRAYIVPAIPETVFALNGFAMTRDMLLMLLFALLMVTASFSMIRKDQKKTEVEEESGGKRINYGFIPLEGAVIGVLTGILGAGCGFLIVPWLVIFSRIPIRIAVGTSLVIISLNTLTGFAGASRNTLMDWTTILIVTGFAMLGIFAGLVLSRRIAGNKLKPLFGWFVLTMGIFILIKEIFLK